MTAGWIRPAAIAFRTIGRDNEVTGAGRSVEGILMIATKLLDDLP